MPVPDDISLKSGGTEIKNALSYSVQSDLFSGSDGFSITTAPPKVDLIKKGDYATLFVNRQQEMRGVVLSRISSVSKGSESVTFEGTDLLGELVRRSVDEFQTFPEDTTLEELADTLIGDLGILNMTDVIFGEGSKDAIVQGSASAGRFGASQTSKLKINPGETYFEVLSNQARLLGLRLFSDTRGRIVFGKMKTLNVGEIPPVIDNSIVNEATFNDSIEDLYNEVRFVGSSNKNKFGPSPAGDLGALGQAFISDFKGAEALPEGFERVLVKTKNPSSEDMNLQAQQMLARQIFESKSLEITVREHSHPSSGTVWQTNQVVKVNLEYESFKIKNENYLIFRRVFERTKDDGPTTGLSLGKLGNISF